MYTEDDEEVKVKNKNSNSDNGDFYTSFNQLSEKGTKKVAKKKLKLEDEEEKDEEDYSDFYGSSDDEDEVMAPSDDDNKKTKAIIKFGIIILLLIVLAILLVVLLRKDDPKGDIELNQATYNLKTGNKEYISYKVVDTESSVESHFTSSNPAVVTVDDNGEITAVGPGEATITISYTIEGKTKEKQIPIKVEGPEIKHELSLSLKASTTNWTNKDVTITVVPKTDTSVTSLKYAINCNGSCTYKDVTNNKIVVSDTGTTKVTVVVKDKSNLEVTKEITTKIDKEAPNITFTSDKNITSSKEVSVCATCSDSLSGCKQSKVCKKYTSSKSNQVITVTDNAGNTKNSPTFNVTISKTSAPCTLKVSSDGTVSATLKESAVYYGFNSDFSGSNVLSKKITIDVSKKGEARAKLVTYYVKNKNGNTGNCYITVIKECTADNNCSFRAN